MVHVNDTIDYKDKSHTWYGIMATFVTQAMMKFSKFFMSKIEHDKQFLTNDQSMYFNFAITCLYIFTLNMPLTLGVYYVMLLALKQWQIAVVHLGFVCAAYACELVFYNPLINGAIDAVGLNNMTISCHYGIFVAWCLFRKAKSILKENIFEWNKVKFFNYMYFIVVMYYLLHQTDSWWFELKLHEYFRFYYVVLCRGLIYSVYHHLAHAYNSLWCVHKAHHYAVTLDQGDGNTISILEFAVAWIPLTGFVDPHSEVVLRFFHVLGDLEVHDYEKGGYHQLHHLFHNTNVIIPVIGREMFGHCFPREFIDEEHQNEFAENYHLYKDTFSMYVEEDNDVEVLNKKMHANYMEYMDRVAKRKEASKKIKDFTVKEKEALVAPKAEAQNISGVMKVDDVASLKKDE